MRTSLDCLPCLVRQTLDAIRHISDDSVMHENILREALASMSSMDLRDSPPVMAQKIHRFVRNVSDNSDPYAEEKRRQNLVARGLLKKWQAGYETAEDPFAWALRLAIYCAVEVG